MTFPSVAGDRLAPDGMRVQVASLEWIISAKQAAGRDKDARALPFLHELLRRRDER